MAEFIQDGNNLILKLKNGDVVVIENFFVKYEDRLESDLVFEDDECAFLWFDWNNGAYGFKEISGLEVLLPEVTSGMSMLPWIAGGAALIGGGVALAGGGSGSSSSKDSPVAPKSPVVTINPVVPSENAKTLLTGTVDHPNADVTVNVGGKDYPVTINPEPNEDGTYNWTVEVPTADLPPVGTGVSVTGTITDPNTGLTSKPSEDESVVMITVDVSYNAKTGHFTLDFSEVPYNPATEKPYTTAELESLLKSDPESNIETVAVTPIFDEKGQATGDFTVVVTPIDPTQDVTVKVPGNSYTDAQGNLGKGDDASADITPPTVEISYDPAEGQFNIDFSEIPYNPVTEEPYTAKQLEDLLKSDSESNIDTITVTPVKDAEGNLTGDFTVVVTPKDPTQDVIVKVPTNSYTDAQGNSGKGDDESADVIPPAVTVTYDPKEGNFTVEFSEIPYKPEVKDQDGKVTEPARPLKPGELANIIKNVPDSNIDTIKVTPVLDSEDNPTGEYTVEVTPVDPDKNVTVKVPGTSYTDKDSNPATGHQETADITPPTVEISYDPAEGQFNIDFSETPYNPETGVLLSPEELAEIIKYVPDSNIDTITVTPIKDAEGKLTGEYTIKVTPIDPTQDVTVKVPTNSYTDAQGNSGKGDDESADVIPPTVEVSYDPTQGQFNIDFSEAPYNPATEKPYTTAELEFARGECHINGIESFWSFCKRRLAKFNGISKEYFDYHLKETEWRWMREPNELATELRNLIR